MSIPQRMQASKMPTAPTEMPQPAPRSRDRSAVADVIKATDQRPRRVTSSPKTRKASSVVATPSKFRSKVAVAAGVFLRLNRRTMGAAIPPARIAPASHGASDFDSRASCGAVGAPFPRMYLAPSKPMPLPRYSSAARSTGSIWPSRNLRQRRAGAEQQGGDQGMENPGCSVLCQEANSRTFWRRVSSDSANPGR